MPVGRAATASGIATLIVGFFLGVNGFLTYGVREASLSNAWMLRNVTRVPGSDQYALSVAPYGVSALTLFTFLFLTPLGWLSMYLVVSGTLRAISAAVGDPRGDPLLSGAYWAADTLVTRVRTGAASPPANGPAWPPTTW